MPFTIKLIQLQIFKMMYGHVQQFRISFRQYYIQNVMTLVYHKDN